MQDRDRGSAIAAGERARLDVVYDRYAPALYAYCRVLLGEPAGAADALADTFIVAAAMLDGLREPGRLRPWLYAVARNECLRRLRPRPPYPPLDDFGEWVADESDSYDDLELAQLRALVIYALAPLSRGDREVLELSLRHELEGDDLAAALGVPRGQANAMTTRAITRFGRSLGVLLAARTGQDSCWKLAALLDGWSGQLDELRRKRIARHTEHCPVCVEHSRLDLGPAMLLNLLPAVLLPPDLRGQILHLLADDSPDAFARRTRVVRRAGRFDRAGFPHRGGQPAGQRGARDQVLGATGMLVFLAVLGVGTVFVLAALDHHPHPPVSALAIGHRPPAQPATAAASPRPTGKAASSPGATTPAASLSPVPTVSPTLSATPSAPPSPRPSPSASASASPSASPSPSGSPLPSTTPPAAVVPAPTTVVLAQGADGSYSGSFTITASGGPVDYSVSNPAPGNLSVSPSGGSLAEGEQVTVSVSVLSDAGLAFDTPLTVEPGGMTVDVQYPPASGSGGLAEGRWHTLTAAPGHW
jgi:RNA polymerase sigma factor (sigma-70 family)